LGSFFFLGALLVELELDADQPFAADRCGSCTRCLDACPTDAFVGPRQLDATRCISYLTIENKGAIPLDLRPGVGTRLYGCDICQDVCPWNVRFARELKEPALEARGGLAGKDARTLAREILALDDQRFRSAYRGSPMKRAKRRGLARNAAVVLGNSGGASDLEVLEHALEDDDALVSDHARWALAAIKQRLTKQ
jgi:epoxyqueuosine reductase